MIRFTFTSDSTVSSTTLVYNVKDYAFNCKPRPTGCALSASVNELNLMIDEDDCRVVYLEGYCPHMGWESQQLVVPHIVRRALFAEFDEEPIPGVSRRVSGEARWSTLVDPCSGWVCIGNSEVVGDYVEFAPGCVAGLLKGELISLWLKPEALPY